MFFFFNDTATTEIYTLSLHDALPIFRGHGVDDGALTLDHAVAEARLLDLGLHLADAGQHAEHPAHAARSEEHTSELQSRQYLVCRLLLEKKKKQITYYIPTLLYLDIR